MRIASCKRLYRGVLPALMAWSVWKLPRWVAVFVIAVIAADLAAIALAASSFSAPLARSRGCSASCWLAMLRPSSSPAGPESLPE